MFLDSQCIVGVHKLLISKRHQVGYYTAYKENSVLTKLMTTNS